MNSLAFFHLPLKVGHVPKRLVGVGADAIIGGSGIGLSGGIGDPGSGSLGSFFDSGSFDSSSGSGASSNLASKGSTVTPCHKNPLPYTCFVHVLLMSAVE